MNTKAKRKTAIILIAIAAVAFMATAACTAPVEQTRISQTAAAEAGLPPAISESTLLAYCQEQGTNFRGDNTAIECMLDIIIQELIKIRIELETIAQNP